MFSGEEISKNPYPERPYLVSIFITQLSLSCTHHIKVRNFVFKDLLFVRLVCPPYNYYQAIILYLAISVGAVGGYKILLRYSSRKYLNLWPKVEASHVENREERWYIFFVKQTNSPQNSWCLFYEVLGWDTKNEVG